MSAARSPSTEREVRSRRELDPSAKGNPVKLDRRSLGAEVSAGDRLADAARAKEATQMALVLDAIFQNAYFGAHSHLLLLL